MQLAGIIDHKLPAYHFSDDAAHIITLNGTDIYIDQSIHGDSVFIQSSDVAAIISGLLLADEYIRKQVIVALAASMLNSEALSEALRF